MGKKDISLKEYLRDESRYADLWNGCMFGGTQYLKPGELTPAPTQQPYVKENGEVLETTGDMVMRQLKDGRMLALWIAENQEEIDYSMPVRVMLEEVLHYQEQVSNIKARNRKRLKELRVERLRGSILLREKGEMLRLEPGEYLYHFRKTDKLFPVVTMVVYWSDETWTDPKNLHEMLQFTGDEALDAGILKLVPEYPLHVVNLAELEHTECFQTELRLLVDLYRLKDNKEGWKKYILEHEECKSVDVATYKVLNQLTHATGLEPEHIEKEGKVDMCRALYEIREDAKEEGRSAGLAEGLAEGLTKQFHILCKYVKRGIIPLEEAAEDMQMTEAEFQERMEAMG